MSSFHSYNGIIKSAFCPSCCVSSPGTDCPGTERGTFRGEDGCVRPFSLEIIKQLYKNEPYADGGDDGVNIIQLLAKFYYWDSTTGGPLMLHSTSKKKKKMIKPSCVFAWQPKHTVGSPQPWKFVDSQFLHSVCFWHLERRNNNYYEAQMSEKGHLLCTNWWMGLVQKVSISRRNEKPISVSFSSEIDRISSTRPKHHKNPTVGRSCAHHWTGPKKKKSTEKPLPSKVLLSLQPVPCFS